MCLFLIQNKLHWHKYTLLCGLTVCQKFLFLAFFNSSVNGFLDLSNVHKVEYFSSHFQLGEQKIVWRR